jgi:sugar/nucleoside kinase (ribokinase family)
MSRLGDKTTFLGKLGNCDSAEFYKAELAKLGGDTSRFKYADVANGRCVSLVTPDSERTMRTDLGAAMTLGADEVSAADFADCQHAHIEGYVLFNRDLAIQVLKSAKEAGCTVSLDLASFEVVGAAKDILADLLRDYVDVVFANEDEAKAFLGDRNDYPEMAKELATLCRVGVVKIGKDGSFVAEQDSVTTISPIVAKAIDTTAAGDFWAAGFLHGWLSGKEHATSGRYGSILGAEVVQVMGSVLSEATWDNIRAEVK